MKPACPMCRWQPELLATGSRKFRPVARPILVTTSEDPPYPANGMMTLPWYFSYSPHPVLTLHHSHISLYHSSASISWLATTRVIPTQLANPHSDAPRQRMHMIRLLVFPKSVNCGREQLFACSLGKSLGCSTRIETRPARFDSYGLKCLPHRITIVGATTRRK